MPYLEGELLENLREVASQVEGSLTKKEFVNHDDSICSTKPFYTKFGSWNDAKREAGLEVGKPSKLTREDLLDEIQRLADEVRNPPRKEDLKEHGKYSPPPYYDEFDSWSEAVAAAGFEPYRNVNPYIKIICDYCGKQEKRKKTAIENQKNIFCSRSCKESWASENRVGKDHPQYDRVTVECEVCGDKFDVKSSVVDVRKTCSESCQAEYQSREFSGKDSWNWKGGKSEVECANCGNSNKVKQAVAEEYENHFCDRGCMAEWKSENIHGENHPRWKGGKLSVECVNCGTEFKRKRANIKANKRSFCGKDCYAEWMSKNLHGENNPRWKGGYRGYYGPSWPEARQKARERDDYICQRCGITEEEHMDERGIELHVHHIKSFGEFDSYEEANELSNLITLCESCHHTIEGLPIDNR